jgi:hypothetical protein
MRVSSIDADGWMCNYRRRKLMTLKLPSAFHVMNEFAFPNCLVPCSNLRKKGKQRIKVLLYCEELSLLNRLLFFSSWICKKIEASLIIKDLKKQACKS